MAYYTPIEELNSYQATNQTAYRDGGKHEFFKG